MAERQPPARRFPWKIIAIVLVIVALVAAGRVLPIGEYTAAMLNWFEGLGFVGYALFALVYILFTVLFVPGAILTLGAGAAFGIVAGFIVVSIGSTIGACAAFLIGRFFARRWVEKKIEGNRKFAAIDKAVERQGWWIVFLTRLSPVFPFNLINYAYGLTRIPFWHFALASWIGMMPGTLVYVWIGATAGDVARAAAGEGEAPGTAMWVLRIAGLLATVAVTVVITRMASRALAQQVPAAEVDKTDSAATPPQPESAP